MGGGGEEEESIEDPRRKIKIYNEVRATVIGLFKKLKRYMKSTAVNTH